MKRFDDNTKKLIKNMVSLLASALVLVAATVAWFHVTGTPVSATGMRGGLKKENYSVSYYRLHTVEDALTDVTTGAGSSAAFTYSSATQPTIAGRMEATWDASSGANAWSIDHLFPGKYDAFRMDIEDIEPRLIINGISCTDLNDNALTAAQLETVYKNVYLYAVALQTTMDTTTTPPTVSGYTVMTDLGNADVIVCDSLYNLMDGHTATGWDITASQKITTLTTADPALTSTNSGSTILLFIGVPGNSVTVPSGGTAPDLVAEHDALRQIGAKLTLGSFMVSTS